jgi:hypothetical protein
MKTINLSALQSDIRENELEITVNYTPKRVKLTDYVTAKTKALQQFGYTDIESKEVKEQIVKISNGDELNVIGMMIEGDLNYTF